MCEYITYFLFRSCFIEFPVFSRSQKGGRILSINGYRYSIQFIRGEKTFWFCASHRQKGCRARIATLEDVVVKYFNVHSHPPLQVMNSYIQHSHLPPHTPAKAVFIQSAYGTRILVLRDYKYLRKTTTKYKSTWICTKHGCSAKVFTAAQTDTIFSENFSHNHPPDPCKNFQPKVKRKKGRHPQKKFASYTEVEGVHQSLKPVVKRNNNRQDTNTIAKKDKKHDPVESKNIPLESQQHVGMYQPISNCHLPILDVHSIIDNLNKLDTKLVNQNHQPTPEDLTSKQMTDLQSQYSENQMTQPNQVVEITHKDPIECDSITKNILYRPVAHSISEHPHSCLESDMTYEPLADLSQPEVEIMNYRPYRPDTAYLQPPVENDQSQLQSDMIHVPLADLSQPEIKMMNYRSYRPDTAYLQPPVENDQSKLQSDMIYVPLADLSQPELEMINYRPYRPDIAYLQPPLENDQSQLQSGMIYVPLANLSQPEEEMMNYRPYRADTAYLKPPLENDQSQLVYRSEKQAQTQLEMDHESYHVDMIPPINYQYQLTPSPQRADYPYPLSSSAEEVNYRSYLPVTPLESPPQPPVDNYRQSHSPAIPAQPPVKSDHQPRNPLEMKKKYRQENDDQFKTTDLNNVTNPLYTSPVPISLFSRFDLLNSDRQGTPRPFTIYQPRAQYDSTNRTQCSENSSQSVFPRSYSAAIHNPLNLTKPGHSSAFKVYQPRTQFNLISIADQPDSNFTPVELSPTTAYLPTGVEFDTDNLSEITRYGRLGEDGLQRTPTQLDANVFELSHGMENDVPPQSFLGTPHSTEVVYTDLPPILQSIPHHTRPENNNQQIPQLRSLTPLADMSTLSHEELAESETTETAVTQEQKPSYFFYRENDLK